MVPARNTMDGHAQYLLVNHVIRSKTVNLQVTINFHSFILFD